jgi:DNA-directed RNA polymerase specialized sigma24 family protein
MAKDVLRKKKRRSGHISLEDQEEKLQISSKDRNPLDQLVGGSVLEQVNVEMSRLRPIDRAYMELVLSGHSYEDISYLTGLPMGTVKSRINWIRKRLGRNVFNRSFSYRNARG